MHGPIAYALYEGKVPFEVFKVKELKEFCEKKGLNFEEEEAKYQTKLADRKARQAARAAQKQAKAEKKQKK